MSDKDELIGKTLERVFRELAENVRTEILSRASAMLRSQLLVWHSG